MKIQLQLDADIRYAFTTLATKCLFLLQLLTFPFTWLCGLEVDLYGRVPLLMEWLWLSWLPLTRSPWLHRAMPMLCQDKVKDHSKPCTDPALLLIKQVCRVQTASVDMHRGRRENEGRLQWKTRMRVSDIFINLLSGI